MEQERQEGDCACFSGTLDGMWLGSSNVQLGSLNPQVCTVDIIRRVGVGKRTPHQVVGSVFAHANRVRDSVVLKARLKLCFAHTGRKVGDEDGARRSHRGGLHNRIGGFMLLGDRLVLVNGLIVHRNGLVAGHVLSSHGPLAGHISRCTPPGRLLSSRRVSR